MSAIPEKPHYSDKPTASSRKIDARDIIQLTHARVKRILDFAELAVPSDKFERFRTLVLDEFGHKGFHNDLAVLLEKNGSHAVGHGLGRIESGKKGSVP